MCLVGLFRVKSLRITGDTDMELEALQAKECRGGVWRILCIPFVSFFFFSPPEAMRTDQSLLSLRYLFPPQEAMRAEYSCAFHLFIKK